MATETDRLPVVAIVGPTATGKSKLAVELALAVGGEVVSCDSTAVYRGFDIGTDKPSIMDRRGVPHHLIDIIEPTSSYSAARYAVDASTVITAIVGRGVLPILVGGSGLYYRALTRGFFPGPGRNDKLRVRLATFASRRGVTALHRLVKRVDPDSAIRIQPRDEKRLIRALEVYFLTGRPLTAHFANTQSPLSSYKVISFGLRLTPEETAKRVACRVDEQFDRGLLDEIRAVLRSGVPENAQPFGGLVYRQGLECLHGVRNESETRALIAQENRRYARRQLIWFRKEPNLHWISLPGEHPSTLAAVLAELRPELH